MVSIAVHMWKLRTKWHEVYNNQRLLFLHMASTATISSYASIVSLNGQSTITISASMATILHMCGHVRYFPYYEMTISPLTTYGFFV